MTKPKPGTGHGPLRRFVLIAAALTEATARWGTAARVREERGRQFKRCEVGIRDDRSALAPWLRPMIVLGVSFTFDRAFADADAHPERLSDLTAYVDAVEPPTGGTAS